MTDLSGIFDNPAVEAHQMQLVSDYERRVAAMRRRFTPRDAQNLAAMARAHLSISPQLAVTAVQAQVDWDDPALADIVFDEEQERERDWWDQLYGKIKTGSRWATAGLEGLWEESVVARGARTGIRMSRGEDLGTAFDRAGPSDLALGIGQAHHEGVTNFGEGFFPRSTLAHETPGFGLRVRDRVRGLTDQTGLPPDEVYDQALRAEQEATYSNIGSPITYEGQQAREATQLYKTRGGTRYATPWSPGRWAALQFFNPETTAFNWMSAAGDTYSRFGFDPVNVPADEIALAYRSRNLLVPSTVQETGLVASRRPWINPTRAEDWLMNPKRGGRVVDNLTANQSFRTTNDLLGDVPAVVKRQITRTDKPEVVRALLKPHLGTTLPKAPAAKGRSIVGATSTMWDGMVVSKFGPDNLASRLGRRLLAESTDPILSPYAPDESIRTMYNYLDTLGVSTERADEIAMFMADQGGMSQPARMTAAQGMLDDAIVGRLKELGHPPDDVRYIMGQLRDVQLQQQRYLDDLAGNPIREAGSRFESLPGPDGEMIDFPMDAVAIDSEFGKHVISLPNLRDVRRATARTRVLRDKLQVHMGKMPRGAEAGYTTIFLDNVMAGWRNSVLWRVGWMLRIIGEEMIRMQGAGYTQLMTDPAGYLAMVFKHPKVAGLLDDSLESTWKVKGLGSSGLARTFGKEANQPVVGTPFDHRRAGWSVARVVDDEGKITRAGEIGLATAVGQLHASVLGRAVARYGVDEAMVYLRTDGAEALTAIMREAPDVPAWQLFDDQALRRKLELVEYRIASNTGGKGFYRDWNPDVSDAPSGPWRDMWGDQVDDFSMYTDGELYEIMRTEGIRGRSKMSKPEKVQALREHHGLPDFESAAAEGRQFIVTDVGAPELNQIIGTGNDLAGTQRLWGEMTHRDLIAFERTLPGYYDDTYRLPTRLKVPNTKQADRLSQARAGFVNTVFEWLGSRPTNRVVRGPFATIRYTEEAATFAVFSTDATRAKLRSWAVRNKVGREFDEFYEQAIRNRGLREAPVNVKDPFTFEEIDELAKGRAIRDTKDTFYDLAQRGNWSDMTRLIFPFADAFAEIVGRWADLLGIKGVAGGGFGYGGPGQAIRNWERGRQTIEGARRSGFFSEDRFGNEVFNFPGFGLLSPGIRRQFQTTISPASLMFVDPSIRGLGAPGVSPLIQISAELVEPWIPPEYQQTWDAIMFGDYTPPDFEEPLEPMYATGVKRFFEALADDKQATSVGDDIAQAYMAKVLSGKPEYVVETEEDALRVWRESQRDGSQLSWLRIFDALMLPGSPTYEAGFKFALETGDPDFWMTINAMNESYRKYLEMFDGDADAAVRAFMDRYGSDPLKVTSKYHAVKQRPMDKARFDWLDQRPDIKEQFPTSLIYLIDEKPGVDFYGRAWSEAQKEKAVELKGEEIIRMTNRQQGSHAYQEVDAQYERDKRKALEILGRGTDGYRAYMDELDAWKQKEVDGITAQHWAWGWEQSAYGGPNRPTYGDIMNELLGIAAPASQRRNVLTEHNPEMVEFVDELARLWTTADERSREAGKKPEWWRSADPEIAGHLQDFKVSLKEWVIEGIDRAGDRLSEANQLNVDALAEHVIAPLLEGWTYDDELFIVPAELPPLPSQPISNSVNPDDFGTVEVPPPVEVGIG